MKHSRFPLALLFAGALALQLSCVDSTAPNPVAGSGATVLLGVPIGSGVDVGRKVDTTVTVLQRAVPLPSDVSARAVFGLEGGTLSIPEAGFTLTVPRGALATPTEITVTALQGSAVSYEFAPHGLELQKKLVFTQELGSTLGVGLLGAIYKGAYFDSRDAIDGTSGSAFVREIIEAAFDALTIRFPVAHFSGYLVAVGYDE